MRIPYLVLGAIGALGLFLAFFYLVGGGGAGASADFTLCNGDEPQTLDPALLTAQTDERICQALFEGLMTRDAGGNVVPGVAESYERAPDGLTYTFHLRANACWNDGTPLTADDFVRSWERALNPQTAAAYSYELYYLKNGEAYGTGKLTDFSQVGAKAPDAHTVMVTLAHPTAYFLELTTLPALYPVPLGVIAKYGSDWTKPEHIVSNGPYVLKTWRLNDYILLAANPHYWRPVAIARLKVLPTSNATACFNLFYSRKTDLILDKNSIPPNLVSDLRGRPYFHSDPFGATAFLRFNVKRAPFTDVRVRQALALALDKEDIVRKITRGGEPVANNFVPPGSAGYTPPRGLVYDPDRARNLLADAGYPGGRGFPDVDLLYAIHGEAPKNVSTEMQALWRRELGITSIHLRGQEWKVFLNTQDAIDYDMSFSSWVGDYNDPQTFIDMFVSGGGNNETNWSDPQYDAMLATSENTADPAKRMQILHDMDKILCEDEVPIVPVYFYVGMALYRPGTLGGFAPNFVDEHPWGNFYIPGGK